VRASVGLPTGCYTVVRYRRRGLGGYHLVTTWLPPSGGPSQPLDLWDLGPDSMDSFPSVCSGNTPARSAVTTLPFASRPCNLLRTAT
jgi:hypothetical protein